MKKVPERGSEGSRLSDRAPPGRPARPAGELAERDQRGPPGAGPEHPRPNRLDVRL